MLDKAVLPTISATHRWLIRLAEDDLASTSSSVKLCFISPITTSSGELEPTVDIALKVDLPALRMAGFLLTRLSDAGPAPSPRACKGPASETLQQSGHSGSQPGTTRLGKTNDAGATCREERIAVGQLQLRQSLPPGGLRFDLAGLRQPASSACAAAISGISGVGEKPSSAGARTAWASGGRPVDW